DVLPVSGGQLAGRRHQETGNHALAKYTGLRVAPVRREPVADDGTPGPHDVGHDGDHGDRHLREVDDGVAYRRRDRRGRLTDVENPHRALATATHPPSGPGPTTASPASCTRDLPRPRLSRCPPRS